MKHSFYIVLFFSKLFVNHKATGQEKVGLRDCLGTGWVYYPWDLTTLINFFFPAVLDIALPLSRLTD
jgi:hypothetical protein